MTHLIGIPALSITSAYVGYRFGIRSVARVRAELAKIEVEVKAGFQHSYDAIFARIRSAL